MNDEIEKINEENRKQNNFVSPGNQSKAAYSNITTNEEDNKRSIAEGIIGDLTRQNEDIDVIKKTITEMGNQINQITQALNQIINGQTPQVQGQPTQTPEQGKINMETLSALGDLAEKAISAYKNLKGAPPATQSFLDQDYINEQVKKSVMGNFEIGDALVSNLKSKLINKAVASSVSDAMKESSHDPQ